MDIKLTRDRIVTNDINRINKAKEALRANRFNSEETIGVLISHTFEIADFFPFIDGEKLTNAS